MDRMDRAAREAPWNSDDEDEENSNIFGETPFPLSKLPIDLAHLVLQKLNFNQWLQLSTLSKYSNRACLSMPGSVVYEISTIIIQNRKKRCIDNRFFSKTISLRVLRKSNVLLDCYEFRLKTKVTEKLCKELLVALRKKPMISFQIELTRLVDCPELLGDLLEALQVCHMTSTVFVSSALFDHRYVKMIRSFILDTCGITSSQFVNNIDPLDFTAHCDTISDNAINQVLKETKAAKRRLGFLQLIFSTTVGQRSIDTILQDLDANPIWTPDLHEQSLAAPIDRVEMRELWVDRPRQFYSVILLDDINYALLITFSDDKLSLTTVGREMDVFEELLNPDQFYFAMRTCLWCWSAYCEHRRQYSMPRFSRLFPKTWCALIYGVKFLSYSLNLYCILSGFEH